MDNVYNYVFHFNPSAKVWTAIPRDEYLAYWNRSIKDVDGVLRSKDINTLVELVDKGDEFLKTL
jgi:hypothetical protein